MLAGYDNLLLQQQKIFHHTQVVNSSGAARQSLSGFFMLKSV